MQQEHIAAEIMETNAIEHSPYVDKMLNDKYSLMTDHLNSK